MNVSVHRKAHEEYQDREKKQQSFMKFCYYKAENLEAEIFLILRSSVILCDSLSVTSENKKSK